MRTLLIILVLTPLLMASSNFATSPTQDGSTISEISLEMTQGSIEFGKSLGRAFKIILRRDGTALFEGKANVKLLGKYRGTIPEADFDRLAEFLISKRYDQINDELPQRMTTSAGEIRVTPYDSPVVTTGVVRGGKQKTIRRLTIVSSEYKNKVPKGITEIENAITEASMKIKWAKMDE